jgi:hypothetical protein
MGDQISIRLGAGLGGTAGINGEEVRVETNGEMRSKVATAVDPSQRFNAAHGFHSLLHSSPLPPSNSFSQTQEYANRNPADSKRYPGNTATTSGAYNRPFSSEASAVELHNLFLLLWRKMPAQLSQEPH